MCASNPADVHMATHGLRFMILACSSIWHVYLFTVYFDISISIVFFSMVLGIDVLWKCGMLFMEVWTNILIARLYQH